MTAPQKRTTVPSAVGVNRRRIQALEAVPPAGLRQTGWTVVFGDRFTPVDSDLERVIWQVTREIVGPTDSPPWYIFDPSAGVYAPSSSGDIEIDIYRRRTDASGGVSNSGLLDSLIIIEAGEHSSRSASSQPVVAQFGDLQDNDAGSGTYDFIVIQITAPGVDAVGLSVNVPIGVEQPSGSGYHIP